MANQDYIIEDGVLIDYSGDSGDIVIPTGVTRIAESAFLGWDLHSINVSADNHVFYSESNCAIDRETKTLVLGCQASIIPADVTCIGAYAFCERANLAAMTIPAGVTFIEEFAFNGCMDLHSVVIPDSVTNIGVCAFFCCTSLTHIDYNGTMAKWAKIEKGFNWNYATGAYTVHCVDGDIKKEAPAR